MKMKRIAIESWDASPDESAYRVRWGRTVLLDNERDYSRAVAALNAAETPARALPMMPKEKAQMQEAPSRHPRSVFSPNVASATVFPLRG